MLEHKSTLEHSVAAPPPVRPRRSGRFLIIALVVVAAAAVLVVLGIRSRVTTASEVNKQTIENAEPTVSVIHPKAGAPKDEVVLPGTIQAFMEAPIYARASGYVKRWTADIGSHVRAGQVLAEIEAPELDQQVLQAKATLDQSQATLEQTLANLEQGRSNEKMAEVTAQRWKDLQGRGVVSKQENDQYQAQFQAQVANTQALEKAIAAARSSVASAKANVSRLEELQSYKTVKAPFDGVITARNTDVGALVNEGNGGALRELFHIASTSKLRVFVNVPQAYSRSTVPGLPADITLAEIPGRVFPAKVARTSEAIDANTRTLLTEIDIDNRATELRPGAYAEVHLKIPNASRSLMLPVGAVIFRGDGVQVGVVHAGKVQLKPIKVGKDFGTEVEVLSGVDEQDAVIANPPDSISNGMQVRVSATASSQGAR